MRQRAVDALTRYINPLTGGAEGIGWLFDADLNSAVVAQLLESVEGVERVEEVLLFEYDLRNRQRLGTAQGRHPARPALAVPVRGRTRWSVAMTSLVPRPQPAARRASALPPRSPNWMLNQLPVGMLDSDFFVRFVSIFQELGGTLLEGADNIENLLDPTVAPDAMVRWLGSWIGGGPVDPSLPRRAAASHRAQLGPDADLARHPRRAASSFLELTSGGPAEVVDGGGVWREGEAPDDTAWVTMKVDSTGWLPEADFVALVRDEVPAHVRAELYVGERPAWQSDLEGLR